MTRPQILDIQVHTPKDFVEAYCNCDGWTSWVLLTSSNLCVIPRTANEWYNALYDIPQLTGEVKAMSDLKPALRCRFKTYETQSERFSLDSLVKFTTPHEFVRPRHLGDDHLGLVLRRISRTAWYEVFSVKDGKSYVVGDIMMRDFYE